jgi:hypothetical protein
MMQSSSVLAELDARQRRARAASAAGWLPLMLTGAALLGSFPAYAGWFGDSATSCCLVSSGTTVERLNGRIAELGTGSRAVALYWLVVVPAVYAVSVCWFAVSRRRTGLRRRWGVHLAVGAATLLALTLTLVPPLDNPISRSGARPVLTPLLALGFGLVALGRVERDLVIGWSGAATCAAAVAAAALRRRGSGLPDSFWGNIGQSILAPSVEVAGTGCALVITALLLRRARGRSVHASASASAERHD